MFFRSRPLLATFLREILEVSSSVLLVLHGVAPAVISFNDGACGILYIMKEYGLEVGKYCSDFCVPRDTKRIKEMDRKSSDHTKKSRKRKMAVRKGFGDKETVKEGLTYGPGMCEILNDIHFCFSLKILFCKFIDYFLKM